MRLFDLSPAIDPDLPVWPGDEPFRCRFSQSLSTGEGANVGCFSTTTHLGSHVDAPLHTEASGPSIDQLALEPFLGPCRVIDASAWPVRGELALPLAALPPHVLNGPHLPQRVLFKPLSLRDRHRFSPDFAGLSPELAARLAALGVLLVGIDTPSIDPFAAEDLPAHHALAGAGVALLEGLVLDAVPAGDYELIALPLRLAGLDASPCRAVLRDLPADAATTARRPGDGP